MSKFERSSRVRGVVSGAVVLSGLVAAMGASAQEQHDHNGHRQPPEEAYAACASKAEGDACSVTFHEHTMEGTCATHPNETRLHCRPKGPPPSHS